MYKADLVAKVQEKGVSGSRANDAVNLVIGTLKECLEQGEEIVFKNFGVFKIANRAAKLCRNPRTGEEIPVPARKTVVFKPSPVFVKVLNDPAEK